MNRACPRGSTGPSRARHARVPPVDYLDKPCRPSAFTATGVQFFVSPGVQFRMSFDTRLTPTAEPVSETDVYETALTSFNYNQ